MSDGVLIGKADELQFLRLDRANRHGLVAGATGTGKTVTLQALAQGFSDAGVPVFAADVKGDLSGVSQPGQPQTARVVLGIPQAYLLALGPSLQSIGETTLAANDTTYFYERLAYVEEVPVPVKVELGRVELTVGELQGLEEGDVIELGTIVGEPLHVTIGSLQLRGKPGTTADGRRLAVQIVGG